MQRDVIRTEGVIRPGELYTLPELKRRLGVKNTAWWALRGKGLRPVKHGRSLYFFGEDIIATFRKISEEQAAETAEPAESED